MELSLSFQTAPSRECAALLVAARSGGLLAGRDREGGVVKRFQAEAKSDKGGPLDSSNDSPLSGIRIEKRGHACDKVNSGVREG